MTLDEHPDPDVAELEKCKPGSHIQCVLERIDDAKQAHGIGDQHVRFLPDMVCRNPHGDEPDWGALIFPTQKVQGMHLFRSAMEKIAAEFPTLAAQARKTPNECVSLQHTVGGVMKTWRSFTPMAADSIAGDLAGMLGS